MGFLGFFVFLVMLRFCEGQHIALHRNYRCILDHCNSFSNKCLVGVLCARKKIELGKKNKNIGKTSGKQQHA